MSNFLYMKLKLFFILIFLSFINYEKDPKEKFYQLKQVPSFVLWKNIETISANDFGHKNNWGSSRPFIQIMTGIDIPKNELLYFVYLDKEKSKLNTNQPKDSIDNIILYTNFKMDCYEIMGRKYVQKFRNRENMKIESREDTKYITGEIVAAAELELKKISDRIWYSKFDKDTISEIRLELSEQLK